ncbi:MAG: hypothetical protein RLZZ361_1129 [Cyanobacteriota bacterium]
MKNNNLSKLIACSVILVNAIPIISLPAKAGVMQRMIEVDAMESAQAEAERIRAQEAYRNQVMAPNPVELPMSRPISPPTQTQIPVYTPNRNIITEKNKENNQNHSDKKCYLCKVTGALLGMGIGSASGFMRGSISKSVELSSDFNDSFGQGTASNITAGTAGAVTGFLTGAGTGILNGMLTGVIEGWSNPFTSESFSIKGRFLDYDPFEFLGGGQ